MIPGRNDEISWSKMDSFANTMWNFSHSWLFKSFPVNDFDVCCKIGCTCKYYVTFFTFSIIQKLCCEWFCCVLQDRIHLQILCYIFDIHDYSNAFRCEWLWCVLQDRLHLQILCYIFDIHDYSKALLWMVLMCFAR